MLRTFADFAAIAGVRPPSIHTAIKGKLKGAVVMGAEGGRWIDDEHPSAITYANEPNMQRKGALSSKPVTKRPSTGVNHVDIASKSYEDPLNPRIPPDILPPASRGVSIDVGIGSGPGVVTSASEAAASRQHFLETLADRTVQEVVDEFGNVEAVFPLAKAMKVRAEWQVKDAEAKRKRGLLVTRTFVDQTLVPLINGAFRRLVSESPESLTEVIVARVLSGGESLQIDVKELIRRENSGILTDLVAQAKAEIERLDD